jgi:general secretion pathway protein I
MKVTASSDSAGFTLLEVMIALAIIAITLVSLLGLANRSIGVNGRIQKMTQATLLAQEKMAETEVAARQGQLAPTDDEGSFDEPFDEYRWRIRFQDTPISRVKQVTVTVLWGREKRNELVDIDSFIF